MLDAQHPGLRGAQQSRMLFCLVFLTALRRWSAHPAWQTADKTADSMYTPQSAGGHSAPRTAPAVVPLVVAFRPTARRMAPEDPLLSNARTCPRQSQPGRCAVLRHRRALPSRTRGRVPAGVRRLVPVASVVDRGRRERRARAAGAARGTGPAVPPGQAGAFLTGVAAVAAVVVAGARADGKAIVEDGQGVPGVRGRCRGHLERDTIYRGCGS